MRATVFFQTLVISLVVSFAAGPGQAQTGAPARDPSTLIAVLADMGARGEMEGREADQVRLNVVTPGGIFGAEFIGCDEAGRACRALGFTASVDKRAMTLDHLNRFNSRDILCRTVMRGDQADIRYGLLLADSQTEDDLRDHVAVWQRCLGAFAGLANDPDGFLGAAQD
ncbi:YbjN domain-containing protein [Phenylobacterium sp.]|uniref:YbjN domain-containing protein n=1 Tax=Phenylobacterium sp. TaxID=1871053 RepID=UPI0027318880|nr:YbjN domain-containing protein [Phenylobacterium sp.]MDP1617695.1 YbjN domain-containing protein [Phenylobacterium sp.]MDP1986680.1 YbjN domain-containing protein [Phenylobacterium sp.]